MRVSVVVLAALKHEISNSKSTALSRQKPIKRKAKQNTNRTDQSTPLRIILFVKETNFLSSVVAAVLIMLLVKAIKKRKQNDLIIESERSEHTEARKK